MARHAHGDPRRPDGDLVSGLPPVDRREEADGVDFGPKVGWGHDAVYRPEPPATGDDDEDGRPQREE